MVLLEVLTVVLEELIQGHPVEARMALEDWCDQRTIPAVGVPEAAWREGKALRCLAVHAVVQEGVSSVNMALGEMSGLVEVHGFEKVHIGWV